MTYFHRTFYLKVTECVTYANTYILLVKGREAVTKLHYGEKTRCLKYLNTLNTFCLHRHGLMKLRLG